MAIDQIIIILYRPQKLVNIGGTVRAMKNMGLRRLRLVSAPAYEPQAITALAHRADDIIEAAEHFTSLDAALADLHYVVGTTARRRSLGDVAHSPREHAAELLSRSTQGFVGMLFGPEDRGLTAAELDRCHAIVSIPTDPDYASLNLAQAVLLVAYELRMAAQPVLAIEAREAPASTAQLEELFTTAEQALNAIEFFKNGQSTLTMRIFRTLIHRASPDRREAALLTAMYREIMHFLRRM